MPQGKASPRTPMSRAEALARAADRKQGDMESNPNTPPVNFERETGRPASEYAAWLAEQNPS